MTVMEPTEVLARHATRLRSRELDESVREKAATCLLDAVGLALASAHDPSVAGLADVLGPTDGAGDATVWASGDRRRVLDAVLANAFAVHARFQDDNDISAYAHPGSLIVPTALSLAESAGASLDVALRAIVGGYSSMAWLGGGGRVGWTLVNRGFRGSATFGCVGAAIAAAIALGLDERSARDAVAIAADIAGGTVEPVRSGASSWRLQNATAAWRGALAAGMARGGMDGSPQALTGEKGFVAAFTGLPTPPEWEQEPTPDAILDSWVKPYPTLGDNMAAVVAACRIAAQVDPTAVVAVTIHQNAEFAAYPGTAYRGPFTRPTQAMASTAFAVSTALIGNGIDWSVYERLDDPAVARLIERTTIVPREDFAPVDGVVEVVTEDGRCLRGDAADEPRTTLYRDRSAARDAFVAGVPCTADDAAAFADALLADALDGAGGRPAADVVRAVAALGG
jgi:2-methylcitrate dehydratase PrpD